MADVRQSYRISEAMEALSCSKATIYRMIKDGQLTLRKIRGRSIIPGDEIREMVRGKAVEKVE